MRYLAAAIVFWLAVACTTEGPTNTIIMPPDTVLVFDTLVLRDTVVVGPDTVIVTDTTLVPDTVVIGPDTVVTVDTLVVTDTLVTVDTLVVIVTDPVRFVSNSLTAFQSSTGAVLEVSYPAPRVMTASPYTEGRVTLRDAITGSRNRVDEETTLLPGYEFVVSNLGSRNDNVQMSFFPPVRALGFWMLDSPEADSRFEAEFFLGSLSLETIPFDPPAGVPYFIGWSFEVDVTRVLIREIDAPLDENDPLGKVFIR